MIRSLILDFDGLILDTETPEVAAWQSIYHQHGQEFPFARWGAIVGGAGVVGFDAASHLAQLVGLTRRIEALREQHQMASSAQTSSAEALPGAVDLILAGKRLGLGLAIASSSPHEWVEPHLNRLGLKQWFDHIVCADDLPPGRTKPHPDLYLKALERLHCGANEAIAFEDSPNGVRAACEAGIFTVLVPNPVTKLLSAEGANLSLPTLAEFDLEGLLANL